MLGLDPDLTDDIPLLQHSELGMILRLTIINALIILQTLFMNGAGLWTAITGLMDIFASEDGVQGVFSCADNSIF